MVTDQEDECPYAPPPSMMFRPGQVWKPADGGSSRLKIIETSHWGHAPWDFVVRYKIDGESEPRERDGFGFWCRYMRDV